MGQVVDSADNRNLDKVSITLLDGKDSFIVADTRAISTGQFYFTNVKNGDYLLLFTYPGYVDLFRSVTCNFDSLKIVDIGNINMITKLNFLEDVVVKSKIGQAIVIRGDTTEYTADSFFVQKNANVEDLLKQLPGIQVDQFGNIKGQGKSVRKVLVDGEEFFGSDPLLVTRNLRADMVDKVQLFDQKSDQANFTGIEDGVKNKTINITLKENSNMDNLVKLKVT